MQLNLLYRLAGCVGAAAILLVTGALATPDEPFTPTFNPTLSITRSSGHINIDGQLDDAGWRTAAHVDKFHERQPGDNTRPSVGTDVFVTYDEDNLYVAFDCKDDPSSIRATMCQRDQFSGDDNVVLLLNTFDDPSWAYELFVNPYGIQRDMLWNNLGYSDYGFDLIWRSAAQRTATGYTVEIAVPFASLRFPDRDSQEWRVDFWRNRPRETNFQYSWAANNRSEQCFPCKWGKLTGLSGTHPSKGIEILPSMLAHQTGGLVNLNDPRSSFHNQDPKGDFSLGGKYALTSDITMEASVNPDFSQIEADAAQIEANSTISLFYPERRPFFQEGSDIFRTPFNSFYTRTINDPQFAAKLTGRTGRMRIGFLAAYDENSPYIMPLDASNYLVNPGKSTSTVLRASQQVGQGSQYGFIITDRRFEGGGSGTVASVDGMFRLSPLYTLVGQFIETHTTEPTFGSTLDGQTFDAGKHTVALDGESFSGWAFITQFLRNGPHYGFNIGYNQIEPTYRTQNGFDPVANHRTVDISHYFAITPKSGPIVRISPQVYVSRRWDFLTGQRRYDIINLHVESQTKVAQFSPYVNYSWQRENFEGIEFDRLWEVNSGFDAQPTSKLGFGVGTAFGHNLARFALQRGNETQFNIYCTYKPVDRLTIEPNVSYARMTSLIDGQRFYSGYIMRTRVQMQATKAMSFRLVTQYNDFGKVWDVDPLLTYRVSPFSVLYVGSTMNYGQVATYPEDPHNPPQWRNTSRQIFMKLQYLFQT